MSNLDHIREARVPVYLDKPRHLLFDFNSMALLEENLGGCTLQEALQMLQPDVLKAGTLRLYLWAGLLHEDPTLKIEEAGAMLNWSNAQAVTAAIGQAIRGSLPEPDPAAQPGEVLEAGFSNGLG